MKKIEFDPPLCIEITDEPLLLANGLTCARCGTSEPRRIVHHCHWDSDACEFKVTLCADCCEVGA